MKRAKDCGLEAVDYNIDEVIDTIELSKGKVYPRCDLPLEEFIKSYKPLKDASEKHNVKVDQMHAPFPMYFPGDEKTNNYLIVLTEKVIAVAAYLNCKDVVVHPYGIIHRTQNETTQEELQINLEMFRKLIPAAKKYNVRLCLENLLALDKDENIIGGICATPEESNYLIDTLNEEAGQEVFGFCLDVGHANAVGKDIRAFINGLGKRLTALHIHDNNGRGDFHMIPYTQVSDPWAVTLGTDWEGFINGLKDVNYKGCLAFEAFRATRHMPKECRDDVLKLISSVGRYFKKRLTE
jgi:sugar phosphate isomerase/epimerase